MFQQNPETLISLGAPQFHSQVLAGNRSDHQSRFEPPEPRQNMTLHFFLKLNRPMQGEFPVTCRITYDRQKTEFQIPFLTCQQGRQ